VAAKNQNFEAYKGDTRNISVSVEDDDGAAVDLTGATIKWAAANTPTSVAVISKQTGGSGISITDASGGVFVITLQPADTASLRARTYYHEAQVTDAGGVISTVLTGKMKLFEDLIASP
jgi:hypothetical protein